MKRLLALMLLLLCGSAHAQTQPQQVPAPLSAPYITKTPVTDLPGEQALSLLSTGLLKSTTSTGTLSIAVAGTDYQAPLATTWKNTVYVDATRGSDGTGALGRPDKPYATILAASTAALTAGGTWIVEILPGDYTDVGLLPGDADSLLAYWYWPNTTHTVTGSSSLYDWTGDYTGKRLNILGRCRFLANGSTTGQVITSSYSTTKFEAFTIEAQDIKNANGRGARMLNLQGDADEGLNWSSITVYGELTDNSGTPNYARIDQVFIFCKANWIDGLHIDGTAPWVVHCGYGQDFVVGDIGFSASALELTADYRIKGTDEAAVTLRFGQLTMSAPKYEITSSAAATHPVLLIPSDAHTDSAGNVRFTINGGRARMWADDGTPSAFLNIAKDSDNIEGRIKDVEVMMEDSDISECISAVGTQDIDFIGTFTSNLPISANVTPKGGGTITIDPDLKTGF